MGVIQRGWHPNAFLIQCSKACVKRPLSKRPKVGFQDQDPLNAGQKYCRMLQGQGEHSAILSTFIKLPFVIKIFVLSILSDCFTQVLLYNKTSVKRPFSKRQKIGFQDQLLLNAGQKCSSILQYFRPSLRPLFCLFLSLPFNTGFNVLTVS